MKLSKETADLVKDVLINGLRGKFENYNPEPSVMPFHTRLLGQDRMALFSFIHSLNTNFGTSIFEPVALALAKNKFIAKSQVDAGKLISEPAQRVIQDIIDNLTSVQVKPNKEKEIDLIRKVCNKGNLKSIKLTKVDVYLESPNGDIFLFDLKTAKPNKGSFIEYKRTLLSWVASALADNPDVNINTLIAIPYNPDEPKPYSRWTMAGMLDLENELKVAHEFWDFLSGIGTYDSLLDIFEEVGLELRPEIDAYFSKWIKH